MSHKYFRLANKPAKTLVMATLLLLLNSCDTLNREECLYGSWYELGVKDGRMGKTQDFLGRHQRACSKYGVVINESDYLAGRTQGLSSYCQLSNAFETGLNGDRYQGVCARETDALFDRYNDFANQVYQKRTNLTSIKNTLFSKELNLSDSKLSDEQKVRIRDEMKDIKGEIQRLGDELSSMERELQQLMEESKHQPFKRST